MNQRGVMLFGFPERCLSKQINEYYKHILKGPDIINTWQNWGKHFVLEDLSFN